MKNIIIILCLFIPVFTIVSTAQDRPLDELLRWFPYGYYSSLFHFDRAEYLESCPESLQQSYLNTCDKILKSPYILPPVMIGKYDSVTTARKGELAMKMNYRQREDGTMEIVNRKCAYVCWIDGKPYGAWEPTKALSVFRFANLPTLLRMALTNGELSQIESEDYTHTIYQFKGKDKWQSRYFYASETGDLLSAQDLKLLKSMISAGLSNDAPIFQKMDLNDLEDRADDQGYLWSYETGTSFLRNTLEYVRVRDPQSKSIEDLENRIKSSIQYRINHCSWCGAGVKTQQVFLFGTEENARDFHKQVLTAKGIILDTGYPKTFLHGRQIGFRTTVYKFAEIRRDYGIKLEMKLDGTRLIQSRSDDARTLAAFMELLKSERSK